MKTIKEFAFHVGTMKSNNIDTIKADRVPIVEFQIPTTAQPVSVSYAGGNDIHMFVGMDRSPLITRKFAIVRTGYDLEKLKLNTSKFIGTVQRGDGENFHVLEIV